MFVFNGKFQHCNSTFSDVQFTLLLAFCLLYCLIQIHYNELLKKTQGGTSLKHAASIQNKMTMKQKDMKTGMFTTINTENKQKLLCNFC